MKNEFYIMENSIFLTEVLQIMDMKDSKGLALPFDIHVREFSRQNKTGGKYKVYNEARLLISKPKNKLIKKQLILSNVSNMPVLVDKPRKNPHHFENQTRNIELANGDIKTIPIRFIIEFNGKKVIY